MLTRLLFSSFPCFFLPLPPSSFLHAHALWHPSHEHQHHPHHHHHHHHHHQYLHQSKAKAMEVMEAMEATRAMHDPPSERVSDRSTDRPALCRLTALTDGRTDRRTTLARAAAWRHRSLRSCSSTSQVCACVVSSFSGAFMVFAVSLVCVCSSLM